MNKKSKPVEDLSKDKQIARLVKQRNELFRLIDEFAMENNDEDDLDRDSIDADTSIGGGVIVTRVILPDWVYRAHQFCRKSQALSRAAERIVGNLYMSEGINPRTGDVDRASDDLKPYATNRKPWG